MELTDNNYENIIKNNLLSKLIDEKLEKYGEENGVAVVKCNVTTNPKLAKAFKISSVPFTIAVLEDEQLKHANLGLKNETYYFDLIDELAGKGSFFSRLFT